MEIWAEIIAKNGKNTSNEMDNDYDDVLTEYNKSYLNYFSRYVNFWEKSKFCVDSNFSSWKLFNIRTDFKLLIYLLI